MMSLAVENLLPLRRKFGQAIAVPLAPPFQDPGAYPVPMAATIGKTVCRQGSGSSCSMTDKLFEERAQGLILV
ncbi:hypothetical protein [Pseudooceanicola algae]|uniref:hypothetical protein n=1 Tax=Pseudooceanicola algae TaxID=1537215 RepID=UPI000E6CA001|nr:hypothetical protein [Pseudooceanicola algae]